MTAIGSRGSEYGGISYPACYGSALTGNEDGLDGNFAKPRDVANGVIVSRKCTLFRDITDGLSNTVVLGEQLLGDGAPDGTVPPPNNDYRRRILVLTGNTVTTPANCAAGTNWSGTRGEKWIWHGRTLYNHYYGPNAKSPDCYNASSGYFLTSARSAHTGGVQVALCDGSVRFASDNVELDIWRGIATRAGGEVLGEF